MNLPKDLSPSTAEMMRLLDGRKIPIPKTTPVFNCWNGKKLPDTFGGKPVLNNSGKPCFPELHVCQLFLKKGWSARWIETYGAAAMKPRFLTDWDPKGLKAQKHHPITDSFISEALDSIARANGNTYSGCWDVVAWHEKELIFAELKLKEHDRIRKTQLKWLQSALKVGFDAKENFLLIEWSL